MYPQEHPVKTSCYNWKTANWNKFISIRFPSS